MDSALRQRLMQLQESCQSLGQGGKYAQCIDIMQQILGIKKQVYGMGHAQFDKSSQKLCEYLNLAAMVYLQKQKFQLCLDYLRKAELVSRNSIQLKSTTYNNLACYYRRTGKIRTALTYLIQALQLELKLQYPKTLADTHLNLCAVLSQLDRHDDALQHSMLSIILLQDEFLAKLMRGQQQQSINNYGQNQQLSVKIDDQRLAVLAIAYHNMGVQFQHLKRFQQAVKIYKKALNLSKTYLTDNQQLIQNLQKVVQTATQQINEKKRSGNDLRKQLVERQFSQSKHNIYKDFARQTQRIAKNLPKLRINKDQFQLKSKYETNTSKPVSYLSYISQSQRPRYQSNQKDDNLMERVSRSFASRKHPRYYKSYGMTSTQNDRTLSSQQNTERTQDGVVPVTEAMRAFDPL